MPSDRVTRGESRGDAKEAALFDARVASGQPLPAYFRNMPIDPHTGTVEHRPGYVYVTPEEAARWGEPAGWIKNEDYMHGYGHGWNAKQIAVAALPFALGAAGALGAFGGAGGGSAAAGGTAAGAASGSSAAAAGAGSLALPAATPGLTFLPGTATGFGAAGGAAAAGGGAAAATLPSVSYAGQVAMPATAGSGAATAGGTGAAAGGSLVNRGLSYLGSPEGQQIQGTIGGALKSYGEDENAYENRATGINLNAANLAQREREFQADEDLKRQQGALDASPLGWEQRYAQKEALLRVLLGNARNVNIQPGDPAVAAAMGTNSGGMRLPEGGFDPAMLERLFGDESTQNSIAQRQKVIGQVNPRGPVMDIGTLYGDPANTNPFSENAKDVNQQELTRQLDQAAINRAAVQQALRDAAASNTKPSLKKSLLGSLGTLGATAAIGALK